MKVKEDKRPPRYQHDCKKCKYLGRYREYDLYWCAHGGFSKLDSLIARFGPEGNYLSDHPPGAFAGPRPFHKWYRHILLRAEAVGLYDPKRQGWSRKMVCCDCEHHWEVCVPYTLPAGIDARELSKCPTCGGYRTFSPSDD